MAMDIKGEYRIPADRQTVWNALNDPEVLKRCIPGCESMEKETDDSYTARMLAKIGPVKARFSTLISLSELNPPESYTISGEGKGGPAGFGKGSAEVRLTESGDETLLNYNASMQVGGKLAQIGSRLVVGTARKYADDFFTRFVTVVSGDAEAAG
ncbi:MAG: carbon monoxide dehydrogenase subunit G [Gammaproteobacteria bacterium]|nr:carbon monoxide dehydrogenase subunit G [Gammaproteobacteria bacterium]